MTRRFLLLLTSVVALGAVLASSAQAAKVENPGSVTFHFNSGTLQIRDRVFDATEGSSEVTAVGSVAANGNVTFTSFNFPPLDPIEGPLGDVNISINVLSSSGFVNPLTGLATATVSIRVDADGGGVGSDCKISPINLALRTDVAGGVPYNPATGTLTVADHTFSVPGASGCSTFPINVNNEINDELGLPSPSGQNHAVLSGFTTPALARAIVPAFTATPSSGVFPLNVNFDASSTFHTRPISSYQWDFDGNGTFDQTTAGPTTSTTYLTAGTRTVRLRVTDADGDSAETTRQVIVDTPRPDLTAAKSHTGSFVTGLAGTYSIDVTNTGTLAATDTISVTDTLPAGFSFSGSSGAGWSCGAQVGQQVTCTTDQDVAIGASTSTLTLDVVASNPGTFVNQATVDVNGDINTSNDTAEDTTEVAQAGIDLALTKTHDTEDGLFRGRRTTYILSVANIGSQPATDRVRIVDTLPAGVDFVSAAGGLTWTCSYVAPEVRCFTDEDVDPSETLEDVRIRVDVATDAPDELINNASVTVDAESNPANNSAEHAGTVEGFATDYSLNKAHSGTFVVGEPGFYSISVTNVGFATGGNDVTVLDQLPAGLSYHSASGDGWSCSASGQDVTCEHAGQVEAGDSLPTLTIQVDVGSAAIGSVTNTAGLTSADDFNVANDVDADPTNVRAAQPDLTIDKSHSGNFTSNTQGTYTLRVSNLASEAASGPTAVTDELPAGLSYVSASGSGWNCGESTGTVTCTYPGAIAGGTSAPDVELTVAVATSAAGSTIVNSASVANVDDTNASNNSDSDPTVVQDRQAPTSLETDPMLIRVNTVFKKNSVVRGPAAWLTSDSNPVAGKTIEFTTLDGDFVCSAVTDADGFARCAKPLTKTNLQHILQILLDTRKYEAHFAGDPDYQPVDAVGDVIRVYGLTLL